MTNDTIVLIADAVRLQAIRKASPFPHRMLYFTDSNLESAFGSIQAHEGTGVALDNQFVHTDRGRAFVDRLQSLGFAPTGIQIVSFEDGHWVMKPLAVTLAALAAPVAVNTRRVPRFPVMDPLQVVVNGQPTSLVDISVMGAQIVSEPQLRPKQRLRITLPDQGEATLEVKALVAWSAFEMSKNAPFPYYRAGLQFTDAPPPALEEFCRRHCSDEPIPERF